MLARRPKGARNLRPLPTDRNCDPSRGRSSRYNRTNNGFSRLGRDLTSWPKRVRAKTAEIPQAKMIHRQTRRGTHRSLLIRLDNITTLLKFLRKGGRERIGQERNTQNLNKCRWQSELKHHAEENRNTAVAQLN